MFCRNCGEKLNDGAEFCPNCGWSKKGEKASLLKKLKIPKVSIAIAAVIIIIALIVRFVLLADGWHGYSYYKDGKKVKYNWVEDSGKWYYLDNDGQCVRSDWKEIKNEWYYFDENGAMKSNTWVSSNGNYYYVDSSGKMLKNTFTPDGYYVGDAGKYIAINELFGQTTKKIVLNVELVKIYKEIKSNPSYTYGTFSYLNLPNSAYNDAKFDSFGKLWLKGGAGGARDGWSCIDILTTKNKFDSYYYEWGMYAQVLKNNQNISKSVYDGIQAQFENMKDMYDVLK